MSESPSRRLPSVRCLSAHGCGRATAYPQENKIVTLGDAVHVAWLDSVADGFRVRIRTLDRASGTWSETHTIGEAYDNHGGPALVKRQPRVSARRLLPASPRGPLPPLPAPRRCLGMDRRGADRRRLQLPEARRGRRRRTPPELPAELSDA